MGEYAKLISTGERIKIGTCEQMYYLRADQVHLMEGGPDCVDPKDPEYAGQVRFRFPFPDEDKIEPGQFRDHDRGLGVYGIEPPKEIDHRSLQFTRNYPTSNGVLLSLPCPRGEHAHAGIRVSYNLYSGPVEIHSQRLIEGKLVLVCRCADCHALYRLPTLAECEPVIEALIKAGRADIALRVGDGYTKPNFWTSCCAALAKG